MNSSAFGFFEAGLEDINEHLTVANRLNHRISQEILVCASHYGSGRGIDIFGNCKMLVDIF